LQQIEAGPLPFDPDRFDVVYANAASCHIRDLPACFRDIRRVLTMDGALVGNEWFKASDNHAFSVWDALLRTRGPNFYFVTCEAFAAAVRGPGSMQR